MGEARGSSPGAGRADPRPQTPSAAHGAAAHPVEDEAEQGNELGQPPLQVRAWEDQPRRWGLGVSGHDYDVLRIAGILSLPVIFRLSANSA